SSARGRRAGSGPTTRSTCRRTFSGRGATSCGSGTRAVRSPAPRSTSPASGSRLRPMRPRPTTRDERPAGTGAGEARRPGPRRLRARLWRARHLCGGSMTRERLLDALFLGAGLLGVAFLAFVLGGSASGEHRPSGPLLVAQAAVIAVACVFAALCARRFEPGNPVRGSWSLLAAGLLLLTLGEATEAFYVVVRRVADPFPSLADVFFLLAYPLLMVAFVSFVRAYRASGFPVASGQSRFVLAAV